MNSIRVCSKHHATYVMAEENICQVCQLQAELEEAQTEIQADKAYYKTSINALKEQIEVTKGLNIAAEMAICRVRQERDDYKESEARLRQALEAVDKAYHSRSSKDTDTYYHRAQKMHDIVDQALKGGE